MADRNWGLISNGATFEELARVLVGFTDPLAKLFGRRGPDGGQDMCSGDGRRVFQAKYHQNASAAAAIRDAKAEAQKIAKYKQAANKRCDQWQEVREWCLVTNAEFNPADHSKWDAEVVPKFESLDLNASYWGRARLDAFTIRARVADVVDRLEKWPHVSGAKPLRGEWAGHYRIRTGDWRVVFRAKGSTVVLVRIMNRVDVYER